MLMWFCVIDKLKKWLEMWFIVKQMSDIHMAKSGWRGDLVSYKSKWNTWFVFSLSKIKVAEMNILQI